MKLKRQIVKIDEDKCDGCGDCVPECAEGAIRIVNGKAKLITDALCDGMGACLGHCPKGAITIEERDADAFDEELVKTHLAKSPEPEAAPTPHVCPGAMARTLQPQPVPQSAGDGQAAPSALGNWPIQLHLAPPQAPWLAGADILLAADCAPFALNGFHSRLLQGKALLIGCPKLDDTQSYVKKLSAIMRIAKPKSITVVYMEVPCCTGLAIITQQAKEMAGSETPLKQVVVGVRGEIIREEAALEAAPALF